MSRLWINPDRWNEDDETHAGYQRYTIVDPPWLNQQREREFMNRWVQAATTTSVSFTFNDDVYRTFTGDVFIGAPIPDRGEEDHVTQVAPLPTVTEADLTATVAEVEPPPPFRMTRAILQELNACGTYVRRFSTTFPVERFPNGVEINQETCGEYCDVFDWQWAIDNMLNFEGRELYHQLVRSRSPENRHFGTSDRRRGRVFGHIFATRLDMRHENVVGVKERALTAEDQRVLRDLERCKINISHHEQNLRTITRNLEAERARLPELERAAAGAQVRQAHRKKREAERTVENMTERLRTAREAVETATAELERFKQAAQRASEATDATTEVVQAPNDASTITTPRSYNPF